ncbi:hypothetical protein [Solimonas sp. SE-A11]|uniref:hypothetical protein n=1 Tax=Solimonas sp. SE-A11 TaxID=3054954 RepID=UPI00259D23EE|nr:hypothetical protein [Solimonas sp. SE-A11]MDM4769234.1 hypothetical protein [Solimonas sp. SE-A11]
MRRSASSSCFRGLPRRGSVLLAACLLGAALPAWAEAPRCDAATCPPLQLQLEQGFEVSRQRLEQGLPAAAPVPAQPQPVTRPLPQSTAAASLSPWMIGVLALAAGMLLQALAQGLLRRRRMAAVVAVETGIVEAPVPVRASRLEPDVGEVKPAVMSITEPPLAEARTGPVQDETQAIPARFDLEPLDIEAPSPVAIVAESEVADLADEALPEPESQEIALVALAEADAAEQPAEASPSVVEEPQAAPLCFGLEPLDVETPAPSDVVSEPQLTATLDDAALAEPINPALTGEAWVTAEDPMGLGLEPQFLAVGSDAMPPAEALADALDAVIAAVAEEITALDFPEDATPAEAAPAGAIADAVGLPEPSPVAAADAHRLETVALLRRLSAQRARGLHPEERLASVFRRISSGRMDAADRSLRELEAFCSEDEEAFPPELMTTRQHIVRGRGHELGQRIDALRLRASDEASGRRLAVAGAFLRRSRFDAVAEVLDELESDLSRELEIL